MTRQILAMGDEAVSYGAIDSGMKAIFGYPGTPSTEVLEAAATLIDKLDDDRVARWVANEKVAYELALGASYAGYRTMVTMKHVGLNVAMDAFVNSALTGVRGGLVVLIADDPGMHSSQNEQDSRLLADFAHIPSVEPSTPQEAYDFTRKAFELSEELNIPVVVRMVTRLAHSRGIVNRGKRSMPKCLGIPPEDEKTSWVLVPSLARKKYQMLRDTFPTLLDATDTTGFNTFKPGSKTGVVLSGMGRAYYDQLSQEFEELRNYTHFDIGIYPLNVNYVKNMVAWCDTIYVFEENYPYIEDQFITRSNNTDTKIHGRRDRTIPIAGELTPLKMRKVLGLDTPEGKVPSKMKLPPRMPQLCKGCGHIDGFNAMKEALDKMGIDDPRVFGDIGCYALGVMPPYDIINSCVEMGASVGMTVGAAEVGMEPAIGVIGDSTFFHSGMTTLLTMAKTTSNSNLIIMDNRITAMTGHQDTVSEDTIPDLAKSIGFPEESIHTLIPLPKKHDENVEALTRIFEHKGPDLIIFKRDCVQALRKENAAKRKALEEVKK